MSPLYLYASEMVVHAQQDADGLVLYYHGPFNNQVILDMAQGLRKQLTGENDLGWRIFSVFVELAQNIYFNAIEHNVALNNEPLGMVIVEEHEDDYSITAANLASGEALKRLQEKCDYINQLDTKQLHSYKKTLLLASENNPEHKGGNIGLVQVALLSQNKINFEIKAKDENTIFFSLKTTVKK